MEGHLFVIKNDKPKKKLKFFLFFLVLTLLPLSSAVTLNSGITLTTTSSNSSLTFLVPIEVTNLTITPHNITLEGIDCLGPYDEIYTTLFYNNTNSNIDSGYYCDYSSIKATNEACLGVQSGFLTFSSLLPTLLLIFLAVIVLGFFIGNMSSGDTQTRFQMNTEGLDSKKIMSMIITIIIVGLLLIVGILIVGSIGGC